MVSSWNARGNNNQSILRGEDNREKKKRRTWKDSENVGTG